MARCTRAPVLLALVLLNLAWYTTVALAQDGATAPSASPSPKTSVSFVLLTEEQVPDGLQMIQDGERTLEDVASGFSDPDATIDQFTAWGWRGNVVRAFHVPVGMDADPVTIDGIYISVHEFGNPGFAAAALDYSLDAHAAATNLAEVSNEKVGDYSRALYGEMPYGNEVTLYVQQGAYLIRLSASSPLGDPRAEAVELMQTLLEANPA